MGDISILGGALTAAFVLLLILSILSTFRVCNAWFTPESSQLYLRAGVGSVLGITGLLSALLFSPGLESRENALDCRLAMDRIDDRSDDGFHGMTETEATDYKVIVGNMFDKCGGIVKNAILRIKKKEDAP